MAAGKPTSWSARATGRVQGVYYRAFTRESALVLDVKGWVRNEYDGSVTALIQHPDPGVLAKMVAKMKTGPPGSRVDDVEVVPIDTKETWDRFEITH